MFSRKPYSAEAALYLLPQYQAIKKNDIKKIIKGLALDELYHQQLQDGVLNANAIKWNYRHGSVAWKAALESPPYHALNLFILYELPGLSHNFVSEERIIAYLKTELGRQQMSETVGQCLEHDPAHGQRILTLLDNPDSLLYRGIHPQRINILSSKEPSSMAHIRKECERARTVDGLNKSSAKSKKI